MFGHPARRRAGIIVAAALLAACSGGPITKSELPTQPEVMLPGASRPDLKAAPTLASELPEGECASQDGCSGGEVCVAIEPGLARCLHMPGARVPPRARNGAPAPPIGLLDGQMMRDHALRGAR